MQGDGDVEVYKVTKPWKEEWIQWEDSWTIPGGDIDTNSMINTPIKSPGDEGINELEVTSIVQDFVNSPLTNLGFHLKPYPYDNEKLCRHISLSESVDVNRRPFLKVTYDLSTNTIISPKPIYYEDIHYSLINNILQIENLPFDVYQLKLYSINGRLIHETSEISLAKKQITYDIKSVSHGIYILELSGDQLSIKLPIICN